MNNIFSPDDFKNWMTKQNDFSIDLPREYYVGLFVRSGIPQKKLASKICVQEGTLEDLTNSFSKRGGKIIEIDGKNLIIETKNGTFSIPANCIRSY
jgi:uncharacterized protein (DUF3820 family)